jgi:ParB family chromosome partitioning protein
MSTAPAEQTVALANLRLSPKNTRRQRDPEAVTSMAASILHHGLLQNLIVEPAANEPGVFEVLAGGTRLAAMQRLVADNEMPADHPVRVLIETNGQAIEASAAENLVRTRLSPAEEFDAFKAMADNGKSRDEIAQHFGVARIVVDRSLKLANVDPQLLQVFREGGMELDQLRALALTEDHEFQRKVWFGVKHDYERGAYNIREKITTREVRADSALPRFVGLDAYEAAGGQIRRDLFGKDAWCSNRQLLETLAMDRLEAAAQQLRDAGWSWVEAHLTLDYSQLNEYPRGFNADLAQPEPLPADQQARLDAVQARLRELESAGDQPDLPHDEEMRLLEEQDDLEAEEAQLLAAQKEVWPEHVLQQSGCLVYLGEYNGAMHVEYGRLRPGQKAGANGQVTGKAKPTSAERASGAKPAQKTATLSGEMQHRLHLHRRAALRVSLTRDHSLAIELLLAQLLADLFTPSHASKLFDIQPRNHHAGDVEGKAVQMADLAASPARKAFDEQRAALKAKLPKKAGDIGAWLATQSVDQLLELLALVAAATLYCDERQAGALAKQAKLDMRDWWAPDAAHFLNLVPKALIGAAVAEVHGKPAGEKVEALKKDAAIAEAGKLLANTGWLPKPLRGDGYALSKPGTQQKPAAKAKASAKPAGAAPKAKAPPKKRTGKKASKRAKQSAKTAKAAAA